MKTRMITIALWALSVATFASVSLAAFGFHDY